MIDANGNWFPDLFPKQVGVLNDPAMYLLLDGPRYCGKSIVAVHKIVKHAWLTPKARIAIFTRSQKTGKNGVWTDDLVGMAIPEWMENVEGFEPAEGFEGVAADGRPSVNPRTDGATRMSYFRVKNIHGGVSEFQLHSLHHDDDATAKLRSTRFSCIFVDELDNFETPEIFDVGILQLRMLGLPTDKHLWIGTTNPPEDGEKNWIYRKWFLDKSDPALPVEHRRKLSNHSFTLDDNTFADPSFVTSLKANYSGDPDLYDRMVLGKWTTSTANSLFSGAFHPYKHVIGDITHRDPSEHEILLPSERCTELYVGWDIGDVNHGVVFLERLTTNHTEVWCVVDSVVSVATDLSIQELTGRVLDVMAEQEVRLGRTLRWIHWSDKSAERYRSAADSADELEVYRHSKGAITLMSCPKPPGSVRARIALVRRLFVQDRLYISAHCEEVIDACKYLKKGRGDKAIAHSPRHLHPFDAMSYALYGECIDEIENAIRPRPSERKDVVSLRI